ncbi:MAG: hypothetical protein HYS27_02650 [Deltaproteobacteria bacterium]|nr:hypothetical protein [Deltaproteobacteria bacterium]
MHRKRFGLLGSLLVVGMLVVGPAASLGGCAASVNGKVDEQAVDALISALFVQDQADFGTEDTLYSLNASGVSVIGACEARTKALQNYNTLLETNFEDVKDAEGDVDKLDEANEAFAQGQVDYEVKNFPTDYWYVAAGMQSLDDGNFDGAEQDIDIEDTDDSGLDPTDDKDVVASLMICRVNDHPKVDEPDDHQFVVERDQDCYLAKKGTLSVTKYDQDKTLTITAEVELTPLDSDGAVKDVDEDAGEVVVNINSAHCPTLEEEMQNTKDIIEDALDG